MQLYSYSNNCEGHLSVTCHSQSHVSCAACSSAWLPALVLLLWACAQHGTGRVAGKCMRGERLVGTGRLPLRCICGCHATSQPLVLADLQPACHPAMLRCCVRCIPRSYRKGPACPSVFSDVTCEYPLEDLLAFHKHHGKEGTIMVRARVPLTQSASAMRSR